MQDIIRAAKSNLTHGAWGDDKIRMKDFPLSKKRGRTYPITRRYRWRVSTFETNGRKFRLMTAYHTLVPEFTAVLAEDVGGDSRVLTRLEFHESHDGWHAHTCCAADAAVAGIVKPAGERRFPRAHGFCRHGAYLGSGKSMTDEIAAAIASDFFRLPDPQDMFSMEGLPWKI